MKGVFIIALFLFLSCANNTKEQKLLEKIAALEAELDDCKNGPAKIFEQLKYRFNQKDYLAVRFHYESLSNKYPGSEYLEMSKEMLQEAELKIAKEKEEASAKREAALSEKKASLERLKKEHDDVDGVTWYKQRYYTHYNNMNRVSIYMGKRENAPAWLRLKMSYTGDNWIFFKEAYLSYDGNTRSFSFDDYRDKKSDNDGGDVWEWIDISLSDADKNWLKDFAKSPNAKMRLTGKYEKTRTLTENERKGILDVIGAYEYFKAL